MFRLKSCGAWKTADLLQKTNNHLQYPSRKFLWIYLKIEERKRKKEWVKGTLYSLMDVSMGPLFRQSMIALAHTMVRLTWLADQDGKEWMRRWPVQCPQAGTDWQRHCWRTMVAKSNVGWQMWNSRWTWKPEDFLRQQREPPAQPGSRRKRGSGPCLRYKQSRIPDKTEFSSSAV